MNRNQRGFSLLEVLLAVGLLASSLAIIMSGVWTALKFQTRDEEMLQAIFLVNNKMVEVEAELYNEMAKKRFPDEKIESGEFKKPYEMYKWNYEIKKVEIPMAKSEDGGSQVMQNVMGNVLRDISKAVRELKVQVTWTDSESESERDVSVVTHLVKLK